MTEAGTDPFRFRWVSWMIQVIQRTSDYGLFGNRRLLGIISFVDVLHISSFRSSDHHAEKQISCINTSQTLSLLGLLAPISHGLSQNLGGHAWSRCKLVYQTANASQPITTTRSPQASPSSYHHHHPPPPPPLQATSPSSDAQPSNPHPRKPTSSSPQT